METNNEQKDTIPYYLRPALRKTKPRTYRIYEDQEKQLDVKTNGGSSIVIRLLIDKYLADELPEVEVALNNEIFLREHAKKLTGS